MLCVNVDISALFIDEMLESLTNQIAWRKPDWVKNFCPWQQLLYGAVLKGSFIPHYNSMLNQPAPSYSPSPSSSTNRLPMRTVWCDPYWRRVWETPPKRPSFHRQLNTTCGGTGHKCFPTQEATSGCKITEISVHTGIKWSASTQLVRKHEAISAGFFAFLSKALSQLILKEKSNLPAALQNN